MNAREPTQPKTLFEDKSHAHVMCGHCPATVSPQVAERSNVFRRRIFEFAPDTFAAIEYCGSSVMVVGDEGAVVVGVLSHIEDGGLVAGHFAKLRGDKPIRAVVYNDSLVDNYGGIDCFVSEADVRSGAVSVIAHEAFDGVLKNVGDVGNIHIWRAAYQVGGFLEKGPEGLVHAGAVAPAPVRGKVTYIAPNVLVGKFWKGKLGGVETEIYHLPAESDDGIVTYFPKQKTLVVGHVLFGDVLPQVYAQRGIVRYPKRWYKGIEDLIELVERLDVEYMVPMHFFEPLVGRERIMEVLTINRDTLQFIADQGARFINQGWRPDDLATLQLPPSLARHPDLQEHYGRLQQHMRQQFHDHLGWYQGDPTFLDPLPTRERARQYVDALGGRGTILDKARKATEPLWAAELLSWLIIDNPDDGEARQSRADIFRQLGFAAPNATYRNWFLTAALELENRLPPIKMSKSMMIPEQILKNFSPLELAETLKPRLIAEKAFDLEYAIALRFDDHPGQVSLLLRHGVLVTQEKPFTRSDAALRMPLAVLRDLIDNKLTLALAIADKRLVVEHGERRILDEIETLFELSSGGNYPVALPTRAKFGVS